MPLRITDGIPINPQPAPPPVHEDSLPDAPVQPDTEHPNPLEIAPISQKERLWCWAACMEMVLNGDGNSAQLERQCSIIARIPALKAKDCCGNEDNFADRSLPAREMKNVWLNLFGIQAEEHLRAADSSGQIDFADVKTEIQENRPIEVAVRWFEGGSHALIIKGFGEINGRPSVWINDPLMTKSLFSAKTLFSENGGQGQILFSELMRANNYGRWVGTWTGLKK
jgi:hypothetical protein